MLLAEQGRVKYDDSLDNHLPELGLGRQIISSRAAAHRHSSYTPAARRC
jgi:hypothetical protein